MEKDAELKKLDPLTVLRLVALQVQYPELYWEIVRLPEGLEVLEKSYNGPVSDAELQRYGNLQEPLKKLRVAYHRPESRLAKIFEGSNFAAIKAQIPIYLSMLGGAGA
jgi:hypothetical protein